MCDSGRRAYHNQRVHLTNLRRLDNDEESKCANVLAALRSFQRREATGMKSVSGSLTAAPNILCESVFV